MLVNGGEPIWVEVLGVYLYRSRPLICPTLPNQGDSDVAKVIAGDEGRYLRTVDVALHGEIEAACTEFD